MKYEFELIRTDVIQIKNLNQRFNTVWVVPYPFIIPFSNLPNFDSSTGIIIEKDYYKFIDPKGNYEEMVAQLQNFMIKEML